MDLLSPLFFVFLLVVLIVHRLVPASLRPVTLLTASLCFVGYVNAGSLVAVVLFSIFTYLLAFRIKGRSSLFAAGMILHVLAIISFNYFSIDGSGLNFRISDIEFNMGSFILALGLSFYSLQNIAYLNEVYAGRRKAENDLVGFMLYNAYFPKVTSGPVMMPDEFLSSVRDTVASAGQLQSGFQRMLLGAFKKLVIADKLAPAVASIFDYNDHYPGITTATAACLFTVQLYFDFSGYTDMAIGISEMFGIRLKENFLLPLRSTSVAEFWRRWHVSLISWFTQTIYYPLVFRLRKHKKMAAIAGITVTFLVSALWHGTGLTFLVWGACHVVYLCFELLTKKQRGRLSLKIHPVFYNSVSALLVFAAVSFSHLFFRAGSMQTAVRLMGDLSSFWPSDWTRKFLAPLAVGGHQQDLFNFYTTLIIAAVVLLFERRINKAGSSEKFSPWFVCGCLFMIFVFGAIGNSGRFIYMQF